MINRIYQTRLQNRMDSFSKDYVGAQPEAQPDHDYSRDSLNMPVLTNSVAKRSPRKPNIIFAMADCLGWGDVQYNNGNANTPSLNEMAQSSNAILLQRYYSGSPVCSPTRGTVLTGRNHNRYCLWAVNGGFNRPDFTRPQLMPLPLSEITVAELLRGAGYSTALFGKWHLGDFKELKGGSGQCRIPGCMGLTNGKQRKDLCKRAPRIADASQVQSVLMAIMEIDHHALIITLTSQMPSKVGLNPSRKETHISFGYLLKII